MPPATAATSAHHGAAAGHAAGAHDAPLHGLEQGVHRAAEESRRRAEGTDPPRAHQPIDGEDDEEHRRDRDERPADQKDQEIDYLDRIGHDTKSAGRRLALAQRGASLQTVDVRR